MQLEQQVDKILSTVLDNKAKLNDLDHRIVRIENAQQKTFLKLDEFISLMKHQNYGTCCTSCKAQPS